MTLSYPNPSLSDIAEDPKHQRQAAAASESGTEGNSRRERAAAAPIHHGGQTTTTITQKPSLRRILLTAIPEAVGALVGITLSISYVLGPLLGGGYLDGRWELTKGCLPSVPFGALAVIGICALWPQDQRRHRYDARMAVSKIDFLGNVLLILASILLIFGLQQGGSFVWKWSSPVIIWSLAASGTCWILLCVWESYLFSRKGHGETTIQPIFPRALTADRVYLCSLVVTMLTGFVYIALVIKIPEQLQIIYGDNALMAGVHLLPLLGPCAFGSFLGGGLSKKKNLTSQTLIMGTSLQVLGIGLVYGFTSADAETDIRFLLGFTAIYGLGVGLCFAACTMIASIVVHHTDLAAAQGAVAQARVFGGAIGLAVCTIMFNECLERKLGAGSGSGLSESELVEIHRSPMGVVTMSADGLREVKEVYMESFKGQMLMLVIVAAAAVVVSLGTYRSNPVPVVETLMQHHKEFAARSVDTELESGGSVRSLVR
ncbi:hypothetical protein B0T17DRAFT_588646 [Bombardia bombarda]|uniref:MFS general substrate transporter n=1 Tax=Bombardia bombarda TaxID=252184 RepID=A0AA40C7M5_9PEZI|nr:hypothetical protein B0T17DRAFT_588646 [Bombardia bombarda]